MLAKCKQQFQASVAPEVKVVHSLQMVLSDLKVQYFQGFRENILIKLVFDLKFKIKEQKRSI